VTTHESEKISKISELKPNIEPKAADEQKTDVKSSVDQIANSLADAMPQVQQHAIDQHLLETEEAENAYSDLEDAQGNKGVFDPAIHKTNKDGEPTLSTKGKLIKKPFSKKSNDAPHQTKSVIGGQSNKQTSPEQQLKIQSRASGAMAANLLMTMGVVIGGEEWHPMQDNNTGLNEKLMLESAFADYFEATGKSDIPPGLALTAAIGAYMLPRFTMPKTQSRLVKVKSWFARKIADRKLKKHGLKAEKVDNKE
jgi:hypothetical protein